MSAISAGTSRSVARRTVRCAAAAGEATDGRAAAMAAPAGDPSLTRAWLRIALMLPGRMPGAALRGPEMLMRPSSSVLVLFRQHLLALLGRELLLEDGDLVVPGVRDVEPRGLTIEPVGGLGIASAAEAVELAPGEHLDVAGARAAIPDVGDHLGKAGLVGLGRRRRRLGRRRQVLEVLLAGGIRRLEAAIGAIEIVELRACGRAERHCAQDQQHTHNARHAPHHSRARRGARIGLALGGTLLLAACGYIPGEWTPPAGFLGRQVNPRPEPVALTDRD